MSEADIDAEGTAVSAESETADIESTESTTEGAETKAEESSDAEGSSGDDQPKVSEEAQQKRNPFQERISQLTNRAKEAESRARELEEQIKASESAESPQIPPMPSLEDFDYDQNAYTQAVTGWIANQQALQVNQAMTQQQRWQAEQARKQAQLETINAFKARQEAFESDHPDFKSTVSKYQFQSQHVAEAIINSENGPALAYHLAQNPKLAQTIESSNPVYALMELGRIEARLSAPPPVTQSKAPPPADDVTPSGTTQKDPEKMSMHQYAEMRRKQMAGKF